MGEPKITKLENEMEKIVSVENGTIDIRPTYSYWKSTCVETAVFNIGEYEIHYENKVTVEQIKETEKAIQFSFINSGDKEDGFKPEKVWIPKSQIQETEDGIEIPMWMVKEKRIGHHVFKKTVVTVQER